MAIAHVMIGMMSKPGVVGVLFGDLPMEFDPDTAREIGKKLIEKADEAVEKMMKEIEGAE